MWLGWEIKWLSIELCGKWIKETQDLRLEPCLSSNRVNGIIFSSELLRIKKKIDEFFQNEICSPCKQIPERKIKSLQSINTLPWNYFFLVHLCKYFRMTRLRNIMSKEGGRWPWLIGLSVNYLIINILLKNIQPEVRMLVNTEVNGVI